MMKTCLEVKSLWEIKLFIKLESHFAIFSTHLLSYKQNNFI